MVVSQTIPLIVLAPLVIIWFGFGIAPKIVLVALFTFFATAVGTVQGLASADPDAMSTAAHDGRDARRSCSGVCALPSALPQFFTGLKVWITFAYVAAIFAEYVGATQGLGYYMTVGQHGVQHRTRVRRGDRQRRCSRSCCSLIVAALERAALRWRPPAPGARVSGEHRTRVERRAGAGSPGRGLEVPP